MKTIINVRSIKSSWDLAWSKVNKIGDSCEIRVRGKIKARVWIDSQGHQSITY